MMVARLVRSLPSFASRVAVSSTSFLLRFGCGEMAIAGTTGNFDLRMVTDMVGMMKLGDEMLPLPHRLLRVIYLFSSNCIG